MEYLDKEVYFHLYCERCKNYNEEDPDEYSEVCDDCLSNPMNRHSHKPVNFEEDE